MVKSYFLKISGRETAAYSAEQVSQLFADGQIDRNTPCREAKAAGGAWRTIDDLLPTLKYGTQLPAPTPARAPRVSISSTRAAGARPRPDQTVAIVDVNVPFASVFRMVMKVFGSLLIIWACFAVIAVVVWTILMFLFVGVLGGALSGTHH